MGCSVYYQTLLPTEQRYIDFLSSSEIKMRERERMCVCMCKTRIAKKCREHELMKHMIKAKEYNNVNIFERNIWCVSPLVYLQ
mgnify:CR=1 FL=1